MSRLERSYDLNKAAELKYGKLPQLQKELEEEEKLAEQSKSASMLHDKVTEEEIAKIICRWTGIPVSKLMEGEREKLLHMEDILHKRVIGQDEAVEKVSEAILRSRAGIANPDQPIGSFLFLGPTLVLVRRSLQRLLPRLCLTMNTAWFVLICRSIWRNSA